MASAMKNLLDSLIFGKNTWVPIFDQSNPKKRPPDRVWSFFEGSLGYPIPNDMIVSEELEAHFPFAHIIMIVYLG
jgi:hypothetical protein